MPTQSRKNINLALSGAAGRMGVEIQALTFNTKFKVSSVLNQSSDWKACIPSQVDMVVDFSSPKGLEAALSWCVKNQKPLVSGTTGLGSAQDRKMQSAAKKIPILYSANMSLGIAVLAAMLGQLRGLEDWDFQIEEAHHNQKKDKPSGTALLLQRELTKAVLRPVPDPLAIRGGGVPGIHQIWAMGPDETLILQHTAFNRKVFAQGALRAARWLFDKKQPGLYDLTDLYKKI